jgi:hypothetical protein
MTSAKTNPKSKTLPIICISMLLLLNTVRLIVNLNHKPVASQEISPDQIRQMMDHAQTSEQTPDPFNQNR